MEAHRYTKQEIEKLVVENDTHRLKELSASQLLSFVDNEYYNAFLLASRHSTVETVRLIVSAIKKEHKEGVVNAFIQSSDSLRRNALALASINDDVKVLDYLVRELGFSVSYRNKEGRSALWYSINRNRVKAFNFLLLHGAEFGDQERTAIGNTDNKDFKLYFNSPDCLLVIIAARNIPAFEFVMRHVKAQSKEEQDKFCSAIDQKGRDALILAAVYNQPIMVKGLLANLRFDFNRRDIRGNRAIYYLSSDKHFSLVLQLMQHSSVLEEDEAYFLEENVDRLSLPTKDSKNDAGNRLTNSLNNFTMEGRISKVSTVENLRHYRSFKKERAKQLLRQVATQLYFSLKKELTGSDFEKLKEIQIMHMEFDRKHNLFIVVNEHSMSSKLLALVRNDKNFRKLLCDVYFPTCHEGRMRSARHAAKLSQRIFNSSDIIKSLHAHDENYANAIANLLRTGNVFSFPIELERGIVLSHNSKNMIESVLTKRAGGIYVLNVTKCSNVLKLRHGEEFLSDIAEHAIDLASNLQVDIYTAVAGKKRPCMGCSGRMEGIIDDYGINPGRLWLHTIKNQTEAAARRTVGVIVGHPSSVTVGKDGKNSEPSYDSGSDSEAEEKKVLSKPSENARRLGG